MMKKDQFVYVTYNSHNAREIVEGTHRTGLHEKVLVQYSSGI